MKNFRSNINGYAVIAGNIFAGVVSDDYHPEKPANYMPKFLINGAEWEELGGFEKSIYLHIMQEWESQNADVLPLWKHTWCEIQEAVQYAEDVSHNTNSLEVHAFAEHIREKLPELRLMVLTKNWAEYSAYIHRFIGIFTAVAVPEYGNGLGLIAEHFHQKLKQLYETT